MTVTMDPPMTTPPAPGLIDPASRRALYARLWLSVPRELGYLLPSLPIAIANLSTDFAEFDIDDLEAEFFEQYMSPEGELERDANTFEYEWPVTEWATKDAIRSIFEDRLSEVEMDELAADLDVTSTSWLSIEE